MKVEIKIDIGTTFYYDLNTNMIICYDFYNDKYWCKYDTKYGFQFHWVSEKKVKDAIRSQNKDYEVIFT